MTIIDETYNNGSNGANLIQSLDHFIERAYHRYAVLTILDRALPDARDGLKPVQRRILFAMHSMGINHSGPHRKSARVVGEVLGKYHPHGDASVYDAMVRMAQDFSMRSPLIDGQGNFGSIDGDSAAAMRYTEARLASIGEAMLLDIEKDTVNWQTNFDGSLKEPTVLPTRFPNLLINGSSGIAVGMSTSILPHNLGEICDAVIFLTENWKRLQKITVDELLRYILGPDLPTGGIIYRYRVNGDEEIIDVIRQAYETGSAILVCQSKADIHEIGGGKSEIIITELPFQVQKATILERIASHKDKFNGVTDVRDESDYNGMRVVFEVARGTDPQDVLDRLLTHTQMRDSISHNALALIRQAESSGKAMPQYLSLRDMLEQFINFRLEVITKRSMFELEKAEARLHIVSGLLKALNMIDVVIEIIRRSQTTETAKVNLMKKLSLSDIQAQAILDMPLRRLVSLERKKLEEEEKSLKIQIIDLRDLLSSEKRRLEVVSHETNEIKEKFSTPRRTVIIDSEEGHQAAVTVADLVLPTKTQTVIITQNNISRHNHDEYRDSLPLGKPTSRAVDIPMFKLSAEPSDVLILISNRGRLWHANIGRLPQQATFPDLGLKDDEQIIGCGIFKDESYLILVTRSGNVKRISLADCIPGRAETTWGLVIGLSNENDEVILASIATGEAQVLICTSGTIETFPRVLRFESSSITPQATPSAKGVSAIKMLDDKLIGGAVIEPKDVNNYAIIITENGHIKRLILDEFPLQKRAGQGVLCWRPTSNSGFIIGFHTGYENSIINIYSGKGRRLRITISDIALSNRTAKGQLLSEIFGSDSVLFSNDEIKGLSIC